MCVCNVVLVCVWGCLLDFARCACVVCVDGACADRVLWMCVCVLVFGVGVCFCRTVL